MITGNELLLILFDSGRRYSSGRVQKDYYRKYRSCCIHAFLGGLSNLLVHVTRPYHVVESIEIFKLSSFWKC